ncbi:uncharacterized protein LOC131034334 [Cryptomeria japonica]|uniref:uncharacterized protein LOC131034334 n=1 Tax=Cryptomeria japonica TaxID=3369 RepID=UPI0027DA5384|nr:uncharacterized protein LOC131034334 [Cryptomeria japonica]
MASPIKESTIPTTENVLETGTSSTTPDITHVVPIDIIAPMSVLENAPIVEPDPKPIPQTSMEAEASSPPKEKTTQARKKRASKRETIVGSDNEPYKESVPAPKARKPTQKRRRVAKKDSRETSSVEAPPSIQSPHTVEEQAAKEPEPQEEAS